MRIVAITQTAVVPDNAGQLLQSECLMDQLEQSRLSWQRAQAEVQTAMGELERCVAELADARVIIEARKVLVARQKVAEDLLQRYITQLGKS